MNNFRTSFEGNLDNRNLRSFRVNLIRKLLKYSLLLCLLGMPISGQIQYSPMCREVEAKVLGLLHISETKRQVSYSDECEYYIISEHNWISLYVEKYETKKESVKAYSSSFKFLTSTKFDPDYVHKLERFNYWSEAKGYSRKSEADHLVMLRYEKIKITLISSSYDRILKIEPLLRTVDFSKYQKEP